MRGFNFSAADCLQVFNTGQDSGGEGGGVAGRQLGRNAAFACPNMCGGNLVLSLYLCKNLLTCALLLSWIFVWKRNLFYQVFGPREAIT